MKQSTFKQWKEKLLGRECLDEMKRQELCKIHADSMWLAFWGLFLAVMVQMGMGAPFRQYAGELVLFLLMASITLVRELYHGLWDPHLKPNLKTNLVCALVAGVGVAVFNCVTYKYPEFPETRLYTMAFGGAATFLLTLALLQASSAVYRHRHRKLEQEDPDEEES